MARKFLKEYIKKLRKDRDIVEQNKQKIRVVENDVVVEYTTKTLNKKVKVDLLPIEEKRKIIKKMISTHTGGREKLVDMLHI